MAIITGDKTSGADFDRNVGDVIIIILNIGHQWGVFVGFKLVGSVDTMFKRNGQLENEHLLDIFPKTLRGLELN